MIGDGYVRLNAHANVPREIRSELECVINESRDAERAMPGRASTPDPRDVIQALRAQTKGRLEEARGRRTLPDDLDIRWYPDSEGTPTAYIG